MPTTSPLGVRIPLTTEANEVPVDIAQAVDDIEPMLVPRVANQAARDALNSSLEIGQLVTTTDGSALWIKTGASSWRLLNAQTSVTSGLFVPETDWDVATEYGYKEGGEMGWVSITVTRTSVTALTATSVGNIVGDPKVGTLQSGWTPNGADIITIGTVGTTAVSLRITAAGSVNILDGRGGSSIIEDDVLRFSFTARLN